jgi:1,4-alpha-glucan branching enzyme
MKAPFLGEQDLHLFCEGTHYRAYRRLGAHLARVDGQAGVHFAVWAPNAERVSAVGEWNGWDGDRHPLHRRGDSGLWEGFVPGLANGSVYKYRIRSRIAKYRVDKADPFGFRHDEAPWTRGEANAS